MKLPTKHLGLTPMIRVEYSCDIVARVLCWLASVLKECFAVFVERCESVLDSLLIATK